MPSRSQKSARSTEPVNFERPRGTCGRLVDAGRAQLDAIAVTHQLLDQRQRDVVKARLAPHGSQCRHRHEPDAVLRADVRSHGTAADAERQVGEADGELPALVERAAARRLDELALVRGRVGVGVPDVPLDVLAEADTHSSNPCSSAPKGVLSAAR
jgi:hypothetical protein